MILYWKQILFVAFIVMVFLAGWHLRGLQVAAQDDAKLKAQIAEARTLQEYNDKNDAESQKVINKLEAQTQDLNQKLKVIYASKSYHCTIPTGGLRLLAEVSH